MTMRYISLVTVFCASFLSSCVSTQILKIEPPNPQNGIVWKITTNHAVFGEPTTTRVITGEFSVKITGPSGEIFDHLASKNLISYGSDGVARLSVADTGGGIDSIKLAKVSLSPEWQSRYDNGEKVQVPEIEDISFLVAHTKDKTELKAVGFSDPYNIVVGFQSKHEPERPMRLLKEREEKAAEEKIRIDAEQKILREKELAEKRSIRERKLNDLNKVASYTEGKGCAFAFALIVKASRSNYLISPAYYCVTDLTDGAGTINERSGCAYAQLDGETGRYSSPYRFPMPMREGQQCSKTSISELLNLTHLGNDSVSYLSSCATNIVDFLTCQLVRDDGDTEFVLLNNRFNVPVPSGIIPLEGMNRN